MDKQFPKEMKMYATGAKVKKAFVSIVEPTHLRDCENCGGTQVFALFCAIKGPFETPIMPGMKEGDHYLTSHYDANCGYGGRGGWWAGITYTFPCPVCLGDQPQKLLKQYPTQQAMNGLRHPQTGESIE